jgi:hypothetical protein
MLQSSRTPGTWKKVVMSHKGVRIATASIETLIGLCALGGGAAVVTGAFGFDQWLPVSWLEGTPFTDYTVPGLVLFVVIGGGMMLAATTVFVQREWAVMLSASMGLVMVGFEAVEVAIIDRNPQAIIPPTIMQQALMMALGLVIFGLSAFLWWHEYGSRRAPTSRAKHI